MTAKTNTNLDKIKEMNFTDCVFYFADYLQERMQKTLGKDINVRKRTIIEDKGNVIDIKFREGKGLLKRLFGRKIAEMSLDWYAHTIRVYDKSLYDTVKEEVKRYRDIRGLGSPLQVLCQ